MNLRFANCAGRFVHRQSRERYYEETECARAEAAGCSRQRQTICEKITICPGWLRKLQRDSRLSPRFTFLIPLSFGFCAQSQTKNCARSPRRKDGALCAALAVDRLSFTTTPELVRRSRLKILSGTRYRCKRCLPRYCSLWSRALRKRCCHR